MNEMNWKMPIPNAYSQICFLLVFTQFMLFTICTTCIHSKCHCYVLLGGSSSPAPSLKTRTRLKILILTSFVVDFIKSYLFFCADIIAENIYQT